jgi:hypothetical protein
MPIGRRPIPVLIVTGAYLAVGVIGFVVHWRDLLANPSEGMWIELTELVAAITAVFLFRRRSWARWLAVAWIAFHVVLSAFGNVRELVMHAVLAVVITWLLFRPDTARWFRAERSDLDI